MEVIWYIVVVSWCVVVFIIVVVKLVDLVVDTKSLVNGIDRIDCFGSIDRVDVTAGNKEIHPFI